MRSSILSSSWRCFRENVKQYPIKEKFQLHFAWIQLNVTKCYNTKWLWFWARRPKQRIEQSTTIVFIHRREWEPEELKTRLYLLPFTFDQRSQKTVFVNIANSDGNIVNYIVKMVIKIVQIEWNLDNMRKEQENRSTMNTTS